MKIVDRERVISAKPQIFGDSNGQCGIECVANEGASSFYRFYCHDPANCSPVTVKWRMPAEGVKGVWTSNALLNKRIRADWELPQVVSRISVDAPVICAFGHRDENIVTIGLNESINTLQLEAAIQEEDNHLHLSITFFTDDYVDKNKYSCEIYIDIGSSLFTDSLIKLGAWLEKKLEKSVMPVPRHARLPLYSTWYSYHQNFTEQQLLNECRLSKELGYEVMIVDDGWQTSDSGRGYDFTGDWEADRIKNMSDFVNEVHEIGMKIMLWYAVPFCGKKSSAYRRFKGKFLTEDHPWAPVFDPRFPDVREYLVGRYRKAIREWDVDGLKLDFIDDFRVYSDTEIRDLQGRDTLSVNHGVKLLLDEIRKDVSELKPDVLIEFRQKYIGPYLRTVGNMFRAFDCPYDSVMNRVRTTDVKLLCGSSAVHSDMLTWSAEEFVEIAALQFTSVLFSVPQLSVKLDEIPHEHTAMIKFFTNYWIENQQILLDGQFSASKPLANYPLLSAANNDKGIYGLYDDVIFTIRPDLNTVDIVNGKLSNKVIFEVSEFTDYQSLVINCQGRVVEEKQLKLTKGIHSIHVPANGILKLIKP